MSGALALREVVIAALRGDAALMALVNGIEDAGGARPSAPALLVGAFFASAWGARGVDGLAVRMPLTLIDRTDRPDRTGAAAERVDAVLCALPAMADGWRIGNVALDRSRSVRSGDGSWTLLIDYVARLSRMN